uniref:Uncharacterized protein n=1 Tax=Romanomermis culicivorax TaxID=13658 RepID=A0A915J6D6_ROMCU
MPAQSSARLRDIMMMYSLLTNEENRVRSWGLSAKVWKMNIVPFGKVNCT